MERYSFFDDVNGDREYTASDFSSFFSAILSSGVLSNLSTNLQVLATEGNYNITVKSGIGFISGHYYNLTTDMDFTLDTADGVLNRKDLVVLQLDLNNRLMRTYVKKGTTSSNPVAPTVQRDDVIYELALAEIYIGAGATSISQVNVTDTRMDSTRCGYVDSLITVDTSTIFNQYQLWFQSVQQGNDPSKQTKLTFGSTLPTGTHLDGDYHLLIDTTSNAYDLYRYNGTSSTWVMVLSNVDKNLLHDNGDGTSTSLQTIINNKRDKTDTAYTTDINLTKSLPRNEMDVAGTTKKSGMFRNANSSVDYGTEFYHDTTKLLITTDMLQSVKSGGTNEILDKGNVPPTSYQSNSQVSKFKTITTNTTLTSDGNWHKMPFNSKVSDNQNEFDITNNRFVAKQAGTYMFNSRLRHSFSASGVDFKLGVYVNGALSVIIGEIATGSGTSTLSIGGPAVLDLAANDVAEIWYNIGTAGATLFNASTDTWFSGIRLY